MSTPDEPAIDEAAMNPDAGSVVLHNFEYRVRQDPQGSLFDPQEMSVARGSVSIPSSLAGMKKAVAAIHAIPIKGGEKQSLNVRRLFDAVILFAQLDIRSRGPGFIDRIRDDRLSPLFEVRITELQRLAGISGKNYERTYEDLDALFGMRMTWNAVGEDSSVEWEYQAHFLTSYGRGVNNKRGLMRFSIDPAILAIVLEPTNWATLSLQVMSGLPTAASYALYQNAWRYINTSQKVTAPLPVETWIELLLGPSRFVKTDAEGKKVVEDYGGFKQRHLNDALERVNAIPALNHTLELKEIKSGRKVSRLQFKFVRKQQQPLPMPLTWPREVLEPLVGLGFSEEEIANLSEAHSFGVVRDSLLQFEASKQRLAATGKRITSPKRYFEGILDNIAKGADEAALDAERLEAKIRSEQAQQQAEERRRRNDEKFQQHQKDVFRDAFFGLPAEYRTSVLAQYEASDSYSKVVPLLGKRGWTPSNGGALVLLRQWLHDNRPDVYEELLPEPQDRTLEAWLDWRAEQAAG